MTTRIDQRPDTSATADEDDAKFWARAASYGLVRAERIDRDQAGGLAPGVDRGGDRSVGGPRRGTHDVLWL